MHHEKLYTFLTSKLYPTQLRISELTEKNNSQNNNKTKVECCNNMPCHVLQSCTYVWKSNIQVA